MKVLVTGADGQLGTDICAVLRNYEVIPVTHKDIEITNIDSVQEVCKKYHPDIIINTAAYVRVDDCETEVQKAFMINALGIRNVAVISQNIGAKLVHISTDYVFGGEAGRDSVPYTEFDLPVPLNIYGKSKLAGEDFVRRFHQRYFIIRTSGLFGIAGSSGKGGNFIETILRLGKERDELQIVNDQIFSPTSTRDLAKIIAQIIATEYYGIFHITNRGICSWYEFAAEILKLADISTPVIPLHSDEYPQIARRPNYSVLDNFHLKLLGMADMRIWQEALEDYMKERGYLK